MIRAAAVSGGFLGPSATARRIRAILREAGISPGLHWPRDASPVLAWGHAPRAARAEWLAARAGAPLWRLEDAFLRSIHPARAKAEPPLGLLLDRSGGVHYDPSAASDLETLLATDPLSDPELLRRADWAMARLKRLGLSKYNAHDPALAAPPPGYVLVVDQVKGDASLRHGGPEGALPEGIFAALLARAKAENPGARLVIRAHPETASGLRAGHFSQDDGELLTAPICPWRLLEGAAKVYVVSSQLGFEAILAGHRPVVAGLPFYAGWGLSEDLMPLPPRLATARGRALSPVQLFAGAMIRFPLWLDAHSGRLCELEQVIDQLEARARAWREDRAGYVASGMRAWKRRHLQAFFGRETPMIFAPDPAKAAAKAEANGRRVMLWAGSAPEGTKGIRLEDGLLRSRGLGADLVPPLSLIADPLGRYYDPAAPSLIEAEMARPLAPDQSARAASLARAFTAAGLTKYNLPGSDPAAAITAARALKPGAKVILVPGQVEDDASIRFGATGAVKGNQALLEAVRAANPEAVVIWKPHPDVLAGLRPGKVARAEAHADLQLAEAETARLIASVDEVWTLTSGLGFEALLAGVPVTCLGAPFYAGWGLTRDLAPVPERRQLGLAPEEARLRLVHAALIAAPRYHDPMRNLPAPPEAILALLSQGAKMPKRPALRALAKLQGWLSGHAGLWRR